MIKIGVVGYGNLGKAVTKVIQNFDDMKLVCVFSRRDIRSCGDLKFEKMERIKDYKNKIDVMIMCGGSATDLMTQSPQVLQDFCIVDSFDTHAKIWKHYETLNRVGKQNNKLAILSVGWDPGLFSVMRLMFSSLSNKAKIFTFWGKGISQGHSDAIRRLDGVLDARQYTIPNKKLLKKVRCGKVDELDGKHMHTRECFVALKKGVLKNKVEKAIKTMPHYFEGYKTKVHFVSEEKINKQHNKLFHGGNVIGFFDSYGNKSLMEFSLKLDSNPDFTASVLLCYARACYKLFKDKNVGALTAFDIAPKDMTSLSVWDTMKLLWKFHL